MAQKHDILFTEKPMTVGTHEQGPQKRCRRLRFPSFDADVWAEKNPLLQKGELGHEKDTGRFKVGDGVTYWADLPYNSVGESAKVNGYNVLEIIAGENVEIRQDGNVLIIDVAIGSIKNDLDDLGDQVSGIEEKIPESASGSNPLITKQQLLNEEMDIREDLNEIQNELQTQLNAQATAIAGKQDQLTAGDNVVIDSNGVISATVPDVGGFDMVVVDQLPETGEKGILYLVKKDGTAPDVHDEYVWIESTQTFELIGTTQVDLTDYVKNTDYASATVAGVVKAGGGNGVYVSSSTGDLVINRATNSEIAAKISATKPIVPSNLDYAVKTSITTNTIELTDGEKTAARTWIGASRVIIRKWS